jgi:hypothetical protein
MEQIGGYRFNGKILFNAEMPYEIGYNYTISYPFVNSLMQT